MTGNGFAWVIERNIHSKLHYWAGRNADDWCSDHSDALRFARRADAELMLTYHCAGIGRVVEHGWISALPAEQPFSQERATMDDINFLREAVFRHYASGDIVVALRAPVDLTMKVEPPELASRLYNERALAALEIELLRGRVSVMGRQR